MSRCFNCRKKMVRNDMYCRNCGSERQGSLHFIIIDILRILFFIILIALIVLIIISFKMN